MDNDEKVVMLVPNLSALNERQVEQWDRWFAPQWAVYSAQVGRDATFEGFIEHCKKVFAGNPKLTVLADKIAKDYRKETL
jgi:hypothetical protein